MDHAIAFAETGHRRLATLHANSTNQAIDRIINFFPEERRHQLLMDLSLNLRVVSQRLLPKKDGKGRVAAIKIMLNSPLISDLIFKGEDDEIKEIMKKSRVNLACRPLIRRCSTIMTPAVLPTKMLCAMPTR